MYLSFTTVCYSQSKQHKTLTNKTKSLVFNIVKAILTQKKTNIQLKIKGIEIEEECTESVFINNYSKKFNL